MCGRIKVGRFNNCLNNHYVEKVFFPGGKPEQMLHYCTYLIQESKPETVIVHTGTNSLKQDSVDTIATNILKIFDKCKELGVKTVFVSGIIYKPHFWNKVELFNRFFVNKNIVDTSFRFIPHTNIYSDDICGDQVHLNDFGLVKLADNLIDALNGAHSL